MPMQTRTLVYRSAWFVSFALLSCSESCRHSLPVNGALADAVSAQQAVQHDTSTPKASTRTKTKAPTVPLGLNLGSLNYYAPTLAFVDVMKNADDPQSTPARFGGPWDSELITKIPRSPEGFPLEIPYVGPGVSEPQRVRYSVVSLLYPGRYTLMYDGDGDFEFPAAPVRVLDQSRGVQHLDVQQSKGSLFVTITRSSKADPVRNVRVLLPGFDDSYTTQPFHPHFLTQIKGASVLRFMDWQHTNNSSLVHWQDRATAHMSQGTQRGAAIETVLELSARVDADPWLCVPHQADDDFIEHMAKLVHDKLAPGHVVYIEYSNELWNGIFSQYHYAADQGCKAGLAKLQPYPGSCDDDGVKLWAGTKWTAKRAARVFEIFEQVFGGSERLVRVLGGQSGWVDRNKVLLEAFQNPTINPHHVQADALAVAPYFGAVADDLAEKYSANALTLELIFEHMTESITSQVREPTRQNKALAQRFGLRLLAYEGGQHLVATGERSNDSAFTAKWIAANRDPRMAALYEKMFDAWYGESGRELLVLFNSAEMPTKYGSWGLLESQVQAPELAPKYRAYREQLVKLSLSK